MARWLTGRAHERIRAKLKPGDTAFDGTAGNGFDALFLAQIVGRTGRVIAWDLQPEALSRTAARLAEAGIDWVELKLGDHGELDPAGEPKFAAAMFNLGYLPGGDPDFTTRAESSVRAVRAAALRLAPAGILSVLAYVGHTGGRSEAEAVEAALREFGEPEFRFELRTRNLATTPRLYILERV